MKKFLLTLILFFTIVFASLAQDTTRSAKLYEAPNKLQQNRHIVFARTPAGSNNPGNASQTFKGDDFIYGRVFFSEPLRSILFLDTNSEGSIPVDVFVEDLSNHSSLYISFDLTPDEMSKTFFDFDILPDPEHTLRSSKEFETGRFSFFVSAEGLENKHPVFKFTIGDASGYIQVDFSATNFQQVKARDFQAYQRAHKEKEGEEKQ